MPYLLGARSWIKISQAEKSIAHVTVASAMVLIALSVLMHIIFLLFNYAVCAIAGLPPADFCAVVITSSQKTLATGAAVVASLPPSLGVQGLIILPFIFAQFAQVVIDAFMVPFWKRRTLHADECAAVAASEADAVLAEVCINYTLL